MTFDQSKCKAKEGVDYPFRDKMLNEVVYSNTKRSLSKDQALD